MAVVAVVVLCARLTRVNISGAACGLDGCSYAGVMQHGRGDIQRQGKVEVVQDS